MSYIAKAFVEVSSVEKMRDLYLDIKRFYGRPCDNLLYSPNGNVVVFNETETWSMFSKYPNTEHFIDCNHYANGDEEKAIELFLKLANMKGDSFDQGQWFTDGVNGFHKCINRKIKTDLDYEIKGEFNDEYMRKITPYEMAEAFQKGLL